MDMQYIITTFLRVGSGIGTTLSLFFVTLICSLPLGFLITIMMRCKVTPIKYCAKIYVFLLRSTPLVLQLLFIYFGLPFVPFIGKYLITGRFTATVIGFVLNYSAYFAEIFRGGLLAIDKGQYEAAKVLNFTPKQTMLHIILPQMLRVAMPSVSNETITLVKDTSLMFTLAVPEVLQFAKSAVCGTGKTFPFIVAGIIYLVMNTFITWGLNKIEKKLSF
ncbi:MAG: amino acid ABC transporter permease [Oscillospiraceae bacterium]